MTITRAQLHNTARAMTREQFALRGRSALSSSQSRPKFRTASERTSTTLPKNRPKSSYSSRPITDADLYEWYSDSEEEKGFGSTHVVSPAGRTWYTRPKNWLSDDTQYPLLSDLGSRVEHPRSAVREGAGTEGMALYTREMQKEVAKNRILDKTISDISNFKQFYPEIPVDALTQIENASKKEKSQLSGIRIEDKYKSPFWIKYNAFNDYSRFDDADLWKDGSKVDSGLGFDEEFELARLRMERLRLEEERLLQMKRQRELERLRGPRKKWYELKTPEFCYEAHKNNQKLKTSRVAQDLAKYKQDLLASSMAFGDDDSL